MDRHHTKTRNMETRNTRRHHHRQTTNHHTRTIQRTTQHQILPTNRPPRSNKPKNNNLRNTLPKQNTTRPRTNRKNNKNHLQRPNTNKRPPQKTIQKIQNPNTTITPRPPIHQIHNNTTTPRYANNNTTPTLKTTDDTNIQKIIQQYTEIHQAEHHNKKPSPNDILKLAKTDPDLTPQQLTQIKHTLAQQITQKNKEKEDKK